MKKKLFIKRSKSLIYNALLIIARRRIPTLLTILMIWCAAFLDDQFHRFAICKQNLESIYMCVWFIRVILLEPSALSNANFEYTLTLTRVSELERLPACHLVWIKVGESWHNFYGFWLFIFNLLTAYYFFMQADLWRITLEERAKHDALFNQFNGNNPYLTGLQSLFFNIERLYVLICLLGNLKANKRKDTSCSPACHPRPWDKYGKYLYKSIDHQLIHLLFILLNQCRNLADLNHDGKLDKQEFSIACFLIKSVLTGKTLPIMLPQSLLNSPVAMTKGAYAYLAQTKL